MTTIWCDEEHLRNNFYHPLCEKPSIITCLPACEPSISESFSSHEDIFTTRYKANPSLSDSDRAQNQGNQSINQSGDSALVAVCFLPSLEMKLDRKLATVKQCPCSDDASLKSAPVCRFPFSRSSNSIAVAPLFCAHAHAWFRASNALLTIVVSGLHSALRRFFSHPSSCPPLQDDDERRRRHGARDQRQGRR